MNPADTQSQEFEELDLRFADFIARFAPAHAASTVSNTAATLSAHMRAGHTCLHLPSLPNPPAAEILLQCKAIGGPDPAGTQPLVLDGPRLYLRRYWTYEQQLAHAILQRCSGDAPPALEDRQQQAVEAATLRRFLVVSGGPGTGKTTTVLRILARLLSQRPQLRVALCAPTGKAAARLQTSIREGAAREQHTIPLPESASTIHRLLGSIHNSPAFRHNAAHPLPVDLLVVDEASMVPLPLMAKLLDALAPDASILLLGDRDQLASVEPGSVLGDIAIAATTHGSALSGSMVTLEKNYRFGNESPIYALCQSIRTGSHADALEMLRSASEQDGTIRSIQIPAPKALAASLRGPIVEGFRTVLTAPNADAALEAFTQFRVLCALRSGPYGVEQLNTLITRILREEDLLPPATPHRSITEGDVEPIHGLPFLIQENDSQLGLFNGDIGIFWKSGDAAPMACFASNGETPSQVSPARLPKHEPAFAMTVHKSQGSEFDNVLLILPDQPSPVLTRELVYTGITRARRSVEIWHSPDVLRDAIAATIHRDSGLADALLRAP